MYSLYNLKSSINKQVILWPGLLSWGLLLLAACASPKVEDPEIQEPASPTLVVDTIRNLYAPSGGSSTTGAPSEATLPYVKFSFSKGDTVPQDSANWDIAFRTTTIIANGGTKVDKGPLEPERTGIGGLYLEINFFDEVIKAVPSRVKQDKATQYALPTGSMSSWYNYVFAQHVVYPIPGRIIVVKTHDGKYAKVEIISYYKDAPSNVPKESLESAYYTFRYAYQPDGSSVILK